MGFAAALKLRDKDGIFVNRLVGGGEIGAEGNGEGHISSCCIGQTCACKNRS